MLSRLPPETMHALPQTMEGFLAQVRQRYGSMEGYARDIGLDETVIARLRAALLA